MAIFRVRYSCLFLILFFAMGVSQGQQPGRGQKVNWLSPSKILEYPGNEVEVLNFEGAVYLPENKHLPAFELQIAGTVTSITITPITAIEFSNEELKLIAEAQSTIEPRIYHGHLYGKPYSFVYIVPIQIQNGNHLKVSSFTYSFQTGGVSGTTNKLLKIASSVTTSVLSSGDWHKLSIANSGIYKIDYNYLKQIGINPEQIDPRNIKIYGNGGGMLPQLNSDFRYDDLTENAILVKGQEDGSFNIDDYILFYGQGPHTWTYAGSDRFTHNQNIYSDYAYYFLTIDNSQGLRLATQISPTGGAGQTISSFNERVFHELDLENINLSGRQWYGDKFDSETQKTFSFDLPGIVSTTNIYITSFVFARSFGPSSFNVQLNGTTLGYQNLSKVNLTDNLAKRGSDNITTYTQNSSSINGSTINLTYNYNKGGYSSAIGYLNYIELNLMRNLQLYNNYTSFRSTASTSQLTTEYVVANAQSNMQIWDVTNPLLPENINYTYNGSTASFLANSNILKEYIVFSGTSFSLPNYAGKVANQDLHSIGSVEVPDMLIITYPPFKSAAEKLAQFRRTNDNLKVEVVSVDNIYNEFSSGAQDITAIRDFARMVYSRKSSTDSLKYVLLFGACSYDYKSRISGNNNFVPIYESFESLDPIASQSSDDYYGFFDPEEGAWSETAPDVIHRMEIGVGRLPARNLEEADAMVNKIIHYSSSSDCFGKWRNNLTLIADDGDGNLHLTHADLHAKKINANYPVYNVNKLYMDAYPQVSYPGGETCPTIKEAINQTVEKGSLIVNYVGHGGEQVLAQETILDLGQIGSYSNFNKLAFFITATCEFGRYDAPSKRGGAEYLLTNANGGAVGIIASTRPVYASSNFSLNSAIYDFIFTPLNGQMPRMGDVFRLTKNKSVSGFNNINYALLGDPSMKLAYPVDDAAVIKINNDATVANDTLRALGHVKIDGVINDKAGALINDYSGELYITIFDKERTITTLGTQGSSPTTFKLRNNFIYDGSATVTNGKFALEFIVPKDISYQFDKGKVSLYAKSINQKGDASGFDSTIVIGGTDATAKADSIEPLVKLYMNDESFVFGGLTASNSLFLAKLSDDNGINVAGQGIGHEITALLDDSKDVIVLNDFYSPKRDSYKEGYVRYPMKNLSPGNHSIKFKCWDTYNNSSERYLEFIVANDEKVALSHVLNYPNPFSTNTTFHFDHNKAGEDLDVMVSIYTISGKLIKTLETRYSNTNTHFSDLSWDGRDDFGDKIGKGVYVYKVSVKSMRDGSEVTKFEKLVLLN